MSFCEKLQTGCPACNTEMVQKGSILGHNGGSQDIYQCPGCKNIEIGTLWMFRATKNWGLQLKLNKFLTQYQTLNEVIKEDIVRLI